MRRLSRPTIKFQSTGATLCTHFIQKGTSIQQRPDPFGPAPLKSAYVRSMGGVSPSSMVCRGRPDGRRRPHTIQRVIGLQQPPKSLTTLAVMPLVASNLEVGPRHCALLPDQLGRHLIAARKMRSKCRSLQGTLHHRRGGCLRHPPDARSGSDTER